MLFEVMLDSFEFSALGDGLSCFLTAYSMNVNDFSACEIGYFTFCSEGRDDSKSGGKLICFGSLSDCYDFLLTLVNLAKSYLRLQVLKRCKATLPLRLPSNLSLINSACLLKRSLLLTYTDRPSPNYILH